MIAYNLGIALSLRGRPDEAEPFLAQAAAAANPPALLAHARVLRTLNRPNDAEAAYEYAIDSGAAGCAAEYGES